jgi:predicted DNA-binding protein
VTDEEKKERVLHTRVPAVLEQELKRLAKNLRVPVSNVVRAILEDAIDTVDVVGARAEGELRSVAERLHRERGRLRTRAGREAEGDVADAEITDEPVAPLEGVVGFQPLLLAREEKCTLCGRVLAAGDDAFLGVREHRGPRVIVGRECLPVREPGGER